MKLTIELNSLDEFAELIDRGFVSEGTKVSQENMAPVEQTTAQATPSIEVVQGTTMAQPVTAAPTVPMTQTAPTTQQTEPVVQTCTPSYTADDLARAAVTLMDAGRQADLQELLAKYSVDSLPNLDRSQYGAFATDLRGLGAQI